MRTRRVTSGLVLFPVGLAVVSFVLLGIGAGQLATALHLVNNAVTAASTIVSVDKRVSHSDTGTYVQYVPTVSYLTRDGQERTAELPGANEGKWVVGAAQDIIYDAGETWRAYPVGWTPTGPPTALLIVGCCFALLSIVCGIFVHRGVRAGAHRTFR